MASISLAYHTKMVFTHYPSTKKAKPYGTKSCATFTDGWLNMGVIDMQVFIVGTPLETAQALDKLRLNRQIQEVGVILNAFNGQKAWSNHPCTLQYREHQEWLKEYRRCLLAYFKGDVTKAGRHSYNSSKIKPDWHTEEYLSQMKRRLYTKDNRHYKQWAYLGESEDNWYFVDGAWRVYNNGKRLK